MLTLPQTKVAVLGVVVALVAVVVVAALVAQRPPAPQPPGGSHSGTPVQPAAPGGQTNAPRLVRFASAADFRSYLASAPSTTFTGGMGIKGEARALAEAPAPMMAPTAGSAADATPSRVSDTNVQVAGVDEPDILKTDGSTIYLSSPNYYYGWGGGIRPMMGVMAPTVERIMPPRPGNLGGVKSIKAFPPPALKLLGKIDTAGDLLLSGSTLVVLSGPKLTGYSVADPAKPSESWVVDLADNAQLVAARLYQGRLYLVSRLGLNFTTPCPFTPLSVKGAPLTIRCTDVYHPEVPIPSDTTYTITSIDPATGSAGSSISFVGSSPAAPVYMSENAVYVTYTYPGDVVGYLYGFMSQNSDLVPAWLVEKIGKLRAYDLSDEAKMTELGTLIQRWQGSLSPDDSLKLQNELTNRMNSYAKLHARELEYTGITKVAVPGLTVAASGSVPGQLLNQFSLDEYQGNLRVATTIGQGGWWWGLGSSTESVSDVYVLGSSLAQVGAVKNLGQGERIYAVRFLGDRGYVVTFKQTDPFYVVNLADAAHPELAGELKIPGFSSYLHPLVPGRVLGVGQENGKVKLSLFDVSSAANPREVATYHLDDYWTEVSSNHHAFLQDVKHHVFYLPGGQGAYIFSYTSDTLSLAKAVAGLQSRRALYLDNYLYVVGDSKLVVLDEATWERVKELDL